MSDASNEGLAVNENSEFVLDLNGYTLEMTGPGSGSSGTQTNGFQFLKGSTIVIKNGTLEFNDSKLKIGIQNYSNLTLDNVKVSGGPTIQYVVSNNYGDIVFKNKTSITPSEGQVAFDAWYGMFPVYNEPGVNVTIADSSVKINGKVEFGMTTKVTVEQFAEHASITCPSDMELNVDILNPPCKWTENPGDGTKTLRYDLEG